MRWGHGHRTIPEPRPANPCHSDGKGRDMEVNDVAGQKDTPKLSV